MEVHKLDLSLTDQGYLYYVIELVWKQMRVFDRQAGVLVVGVVVHTVVGRALVKIARTGKTRKHKKDLKLINKIAFFF